RPPTALPPTTSNPPPTAPPTTSISPTTSILPTTSPPTTSSAPTTPPPTTNSPTTVVPTTSPPPTSSPTCTNPRVRKSWSSMTEQSRTLYTNAIALALDQGNYQKFIGVYTANHRDAHGRTTSLLWRRNFLLAFEDMLRSLGSEYSCLTVPYWDYFTEFNAYFTRHCKNINDCSSLTRALGGVSTGSNGSTTSIFGYSRPDLRCITEFPLNHFCATEKPCSNCLPRDDWRYKSYPPELSMPLLTHFLFSGGNYSDMALALENQVNLRLHHVLGGMIVNPVISPVDPILWSHYATLDLLETIYYDCRVGSKDLSAASFQGTFGGVDMPLDLTVGMPWFHSTTYFNLTNPQSMGTSSYSYEYSSSLQTLHERCDRSKSPSKVSVELATGLTSNATDTNVSLKEADSLMNDWYELLRALGSVQGLNSAAIEIEIEKITLLTMTTCLNITIADYSNQFRSDWQLNDSLYAKTLLEDIKSVMDDKLKQERIIAFYKQYNPENLKNIPEILRVFAGREDVLCAKLFKKYGCQPDLPTLEKKVNYAYQTSFVPYSLPPALNNGPLNFRSENFNANEALRHQLTGLIPSQPLDNLNKCRSLLPESDPNYNKSIGQTKPKPVAAPVANATTPVPVRPLLLEVLADRYESGPLSVLHACLKAKAKVCVVIRRVNSIRGTCFGFLKGFDKHMNMILLDVTERFLPQESDTSNASIHDWFRTPGVKKRYLRQLLIRGDNVVMVYPTKPLPSTSINAK
ncbi:hypothetical protein THRCLA_10888, partial [Thraustotheca clavata]